jgi:competence protein ComEC
VGDCSNNNSTAKLFRQGHFTVLSLGDLEDPEIALTISSDESVRTEVDVMIMAHHGADNGFTTNEFVQAVKPRVALCSSNYANQYEHPSQEIRDLLFENNVRLYTTKTGDVLIHSIDGNERNYRVVNFRADNQEISSQAILQAKTWYTDEAA